MTHPYLYVNKLGKHVAFLEMHNITTIKTDNNIMLFKFKAELIYLDNNDLLLIKLQGIDTLLLSDDVYLTDDTELWVPLHCFIEIQKFLRSWVCV